jgi:hypothetical protein
MLIFISFLYDYINYIMACDGKTYIPNPPRTWNRVQLPCGNLNLSPVDYEKYLMANKGNILQYKNNSASLTKKQIYSLMAKKKWTNRNTTWATQNDRGYTNPNTKMLKRNNATNIAIDPITGTVIGETSQPITCPSTNPFSNNGTLPQNIGPTNPNDNPDPELPPNEEETGNNGSALPSTPNNDNPPEPIVIPDDGTLACNTIQNPCTSYTKTHQSTQFFHPTTDSNVPGPIQQLYWNDTTQTWIPKQIRTMNTSNDKWPTTTGLPNDPTFIAATAYDN